MAKGDTENYKELMGVAWSRLEETITYTEGIIEVSTWASWVAIDHIITRLEKVRTICTTRRTGEGEMTRRDTTINGILSPIRRDNGTREEVLRRGGRVNSPEPLPGSCEGPRYTATGEGMR